MDMPAVDAVGVLAQRRHPRILLGIAVGHEHEMPGTGQQAVVRCDWQLAGQGFGIAVHGHQLIAVAAVDQRGNLHPGQRRRPNSRLSGAINITAPTRGSASGASSLRSAIRCRGSCRRRRRSGAPGSTGADGPGQARARQDQRGFAAGRVADHAHLAFIQIRPDHCIIAGCGDRALTCSGRP
jgi:hypothetical protein